MTNSVFRCYNLQTVLAEKYFDEVSQDSGKYCFGVEDTLKALDMGAVEILIVWENLAIIRYVLRNPTTGGEEMFANRR